MPKLIRWLGAASGGANAPHAEDHDDPFTSVAGGLAIASYQGIQR